MPLFLGCNSPAETRKCHQWCPFQETEHVQFEKVGLHVCMSASLSACLHVCITVCITVCMSASLSAYLHHCLHHCLRVCMSASLSVCLHVCITVCILAHPLHVATKLIIMCPMLITLPSLSPKAYSALLFLGWQANLQEASNSTGHSVA